MMKLSRVTFSLVVIYFFLTIGIVGIYTPALSEMVVGLTPFNLALTLIMFMWGNANLSPRFLLALLLVFATGMIVEIAGVHTGVLFGEYSYGDPLGWKVAGVPLTIGINWFLLSISSYGIASLVLKNKWLRIIIGAALTAGIDILIEPIAIKLDFWTWAATDVPIQNYIMWFLVSLFIHTYLVFSKQKVSSTMALGLYLSQCYFFIVLTLIL